MIRLIISSIFILLNLTGYSQQKKAAYTDYDHGYYLWYNNKWDSAYLKFNEYLKHPDDTLKKASAYKLMGEIQWYYGDLFGAEENLVEAIKTLNPKNEQHYQELSYVYNILGNVSLDLKQYGKGIGFYDDGISLAKGTDFMYELMNGKATLLQKQGNYSAAISIYDSILAINPQEPYLLARIIDNKANTKWLQDSSYNPLPEFWTALKIRSDSSDVQGMATSYGHIANYYSKQKPDSALWYAKKMLVASKESGNAEYILEAEKNLVLLDKSPELKEYWFREYIMLSDSIQFSRDTTRNRFAILKYDFQTIKEDNFFLKRYIDRQTLLIYIIGILASIIIAGTVILYRRYRKRIRQQAELSIRESRLKTSQKVHDVVANGLYVIMNELEHGKTIDKNTLITRIEGLYEKSRNISYDDDLIEDKADYDKEIHQLLNDFTTEETNIYVLGNQPSFWDSITPAQKRELLLVLKELLVNMKKHSGAKNVSVLFRQENNKSFITYKDDGIGFPESVEFGNGLKNTVSRIKLLNGEVTFGKSEKAGAAVVISIPLQPNQL